MAFANFALDDPMPALMELPAALTNRFAARADESAGQRAEPIAPGQVN